MIPLTCWFGLHDYRPVPSGEKWIGLCGGCGRKSGEGISLAPKVRAATRPTTLAGRTRLRLLREKFGMTTVGRKRA